MQMSRFFAERFGVSRVSRVVDDSLGRLLGLYESENQVVIMTAGTSAGKTSRTPQALALAYPDKHIWVSQPRRKAVRKNGGWVAREMGSRLGGLVGWRLAGDEPVESRQTRIHFRVDMSLVARIVADDGRLPEGFLIVDEAHERSIAIDMLLGLIKEGLPSSPKTKVLITSATIDTSAFSQFFDNAPVIAVTGTGFPIKDDEIIRLIRGEHHTQGAIRAANMVLDRFLAGEPMVPNETDTELVPVSKGTVLVLLPGKEDIEQVMRALEWRAKLVEDSAAGGEKKVEVMECHGETQAASDDLIDQPMGDGVIRFVCATEVVRTSVTIAEIIGVVDSLQVKRPLADANGVVHLTKVAISKAEAEQGRGRGGRDRPAFYMPVSFGNEFENLAPHPTPAVVYSPLTSVVLQIASMGKSIRTFPLINRPEASRMDVAIKRLERLNLLDAQERVTEIGREVARFSVDPESAKGYWTADKLGVLPEDMIASAVIENEGIFYTPKLEADILADEWLVRIVLSRCRKGYYKWELVSAEAVADPATVNLNELPEWIVAPGQVDENDDEEEEKEKKAKNNSDFYLIKCGAHYFPFEEGARGIAKLVRRYFSPERSDFAAAVRMYRAARSGANKKIIRQFLNGKKLGLVDHTIELLGEDLAGSPLSLNGSIYREREFDGHALTKALASGHIDNVLVDSGGRRSGYKGALGDFISLSHSSVCSTSNQVVLVGGVRKIDGRKADFLLADMAAPVKPEWLVDVLPSLCSISDRDDHRYDFGQADRVIHTRDVKFGAVSMEMEVATNDKEQAARAFAKAAFSGGWLSEFSEANRHNKAVQERAEAIAVRSGGHTRRVEDKDIVSHYETVFYLNGVVSRASWKAAAEVENAQVSATDLMLSLEDFVSKEKQEEVATGNPDSVLFLGKEREVRYQSGCDPQISLDHEIERAPDSDVWKQIPDEGIRLPSGRRLSVTVYVCGGYYSFSGTDTKKVKDDVRKRINLTAWEKFSEKPVISLPDVRRGDEVVPEVIEVQYGLDPLTGEPVKKFGAVAVQTSFGRFNGFTSFWYDERGKAEEARVAAQKALDEFAAIERERRELETVRAESDKVKGRLNALCGEHERNFRLPDDVRRMLCDRRYVYRPNNAADLRVWIAETQTVIAKVEAALTEIAARNARRERYELATYEFNHTHAHLLVTESGLLFVGAWKGSKTGYVEIDPEPYDVPELGDERASIDADGRYCSWRYIPSGEQVTVRDFAGSGNLNWEVTFCTPVSGMLTPGVWTIAEDDTGKFFYPSIYFRSGKEIVPEEVRVVRAKVKSRSAFSSSATIEKHEERSAGDGTFTDIGDRYFRCGCGTTTRLAKSEWKQYQSGISIDIECSTCGAAGSVVRCK